MPDGHGAPASGAARDLVATLDISLDTVESPAPPAPEAMATARSPREHAWPAHTHPYPVPLDHDAIPHDPSIVHPHEAPTSIPPLPSAPVATAADDAPTFSITVGAVASAGPPRSAAPEGIGPSRLGDNLAALPEAQVDGKARLVDGAPPAYPNGARADGIEGDVGLELVVDAFGAVEAARVVRSAGHGLDEAAILSARHFRFAPAIKDGRAVRVRMGWSVQFRLR
jgi:protein TonB